MITVRCILCKDVISFPKYDKSFLFEHIKQKHLKIPSIPDKIEEKSSENIENPEVNKLSRAKPFIHKLSKCLCNRLSIDKNLGKNIIVTDETGRKLIERKYRRSLKLNKSGIQITCPKCGEKRIPIIKIHRKLGTYSSLDLICFYSCWPLCFFPFFLKPSTQKLKYCSNMNCGHCFGSFYPSKEVIDECKD